MSLIGYILDDRVISYSISTITFANGTVLNVGNHNSRQETFSFGGWEKVKMLNHTLEGPEKREFKPYSFQLQTSKSIS